MNPFDQALNYVCDTLQHRHRWHGKALAASQEALAGLIEAVGPSPTPVATPARAARPAPPSPAPTAVAQGDATPVSAVGLAAQVRARLQQQAAPARPTPQPPLVTTPATSTPPATGTRAEAMEALRVRVMAALPNEPLAHNRSRFVFGVGDPGAELLFVGEAPGADEEIAGEPFVGRAGQLLTKIIQAMGLSREQVYIANVLKWRPDMPEGESGNRKPRADEMAACLPYLIEQINIIEPKCIVALGATAMEGLTGTKEAMRTLRGRWHAFNGIPLMATYHPAYLLRNQTLSEKRKVWEDMLLVLELLGHPISEKQRNFFLNK